MHLADRSHQPKPSRRSTFIPGDTTLKFEHSRALHGTDFHNYRYRGNNISWALWCFHSMLSGEFEEACAHTAYSSHEFVAQSSHSVDRPWWQGKMGFIEYWTPRRNAHSTHCFHQIGFDLWVLCYSEELTCTIGHAAFLCMNQTIGTFCIPFDGIFWTEC